MGDIGVVMSPSSHRAALAFAVALAAACAHRSLPPPAEPSTPEVVRVEPAPPGSASAPAAQAPATGQPQKSAPQKGAAGATAPRPRKAAPAPATAAAKGAAATAKPPPATAKAPAAKPAPATAKPAPATAKAAPAAKPAPATATSKGAAAPHVDSKHEGAPVAGRVLPARPRAAAPAWTVEGCLTARDEAEALRFAAQRRESAHGGVKVQPTPGGVLVVNQLAHACCLHADVAVRPAPGGIVVSQRLSGRACRCLCDSVIRTPVSLPPGRHALAVDVYTAGGSRRAYEGTVEVR